MLGNMSRLRASRLSAAAMVALCLGGVAAGYIAFMDRGSAQGVVDGMIAARADKLAHPNPVPGAGDAKPVKDLPAQVVDVQSAGTRLAQVKNHPVPLPREEIKETPGDPPPPPSTPAEPIKYVGPVKLGVTMLALLNFNEKQKVVGEGKSFGVTVDSATKTTKLIAVSADSIIVETDGQQREIAKADSNGEVVSFLGNKPARGKAVAMKPATDSKAKGRGNFAGETLDNIVANKQAKIIAMHNRAYQEAKKAQGGEPNKDLREKMIEKLQADGIDRATAERSLEK